MPDRVAVPSAEFIRNIGFWQAEAQRHPVFITHHGRDRLVLAAPQEFMRDQEEPENKGARESFATLRTLHFALLENLEEGFVQFTPTLQIAGVNGVAEAFLGHSREQLFAKEAEEIFPRLLSGLVFDHLQRVMRTRKAESFESEVSGGQTLRFRVFPMPEGVGLLFHNETEEVRLTQERQEASALTNALNDQNCVAYLKLDSRGRIEKVGEQFCRWTGFNAAEIIGHRIVDLTAAQHRRDLARTLEQVLADKCVDGLPVVLIGKKGNEISGELRLAPILGDFAPRGAVGLYVLEEAEASALQRAG